MKKFFYTFIVAIFVAITYLSCSRVHVGETRGEMNNNKIYSLNAKYKNREQPILFTNGGALDFDASQINQIYSKITNRTDYSNIKQVMIYTKSNIANYSDLDYSKIQGISFYKIENGYLRNYFYQNVNNEFFELSELTLRTGSIHISDINFIVSFAKLDKSQLTTYLIRNSSQSFKINTDYQESMEFSDLVSYYFGSRVKLGSPLTDTEKTELLERQPGAGCNPCGQFKNGFCEYGEESKQGFCEGYLCRYNLVKELLQENNLDISGFIDEKAYAIRDNILENSMFGLKYRSYYYQTSFSHVNFDLDDAIELSLLLPAICEGYENIKNNEGSKILISSEIEAKIMSLVNSIISKNQDSPKFLQILNDVKSDVGYLKNSTIAEVNAKIY